MYFKNFQNIYYDFEINGVKHYFNLKDITQNVRVKKDILDMITIYEEYDIRDGDTPSIISEKIYGSPYYHWVIMIVNQRFDYVGDFPLSIAQLEKFLTKKYGAGHEDDIHHYINDAGYIVDSTHPEATSISNRQHEESQNEAKRKIKIISKILLPKLLQQFSELI